MSINKSIGAGIKSSDLERLDKEFDALLIKIENMTDKEFDEYIKRKTITKQ